MPRPLKIDRPQRFEVKLPRSVWVALQLELYSELEGKVPLGRASELVESLVREWLGSRGITL